MTPHDASTFAREICGLAPVIPVLVVHDARPRRAARRGAGRGRPAGAGGDAAHPRRAPGDPRDGGGAGRRRRRRHAAVAAADVRAAKAAGALFGVSPGITDELVAACEAEDLPLLGGIATVGEAMRMLARGYTRLQVLPRRGQRRRAGAEVLRRAAAAGQLLPDRRGDAAERAHLPGAAERALRRRLLDGRPRRG